MNKCPHCSSTEGYFVKVQIRGASQFNYNFDGSVHEENGAIHDSLTYKDGKNGYCIECEKRLFKISDLD